MLGHHARLYVGASAAEVAAQFSSDPHDVVMIYEAVTWGIAESRALQLEAHRTDPIGRVRHFVVAATTVTPEAQNALLKLLEEPPTQVVFHCVFPAGMVLLPTVASRLLPVDQMTATVSDDAFVLWEAWARLPLSERLADVEQRTKDKDIAWMQAIRRGGLRALHDQLAKTALLGSGFAPARLAASLLRVGSLGASNKMLLEDVALALPTFPLHMKTR